MPYVQDVLTFAPDNDIHDNDTDNDNHNNDTDNDIHDDD
jgi:hypothetical protein